MIIEPSKGIRRRIGSAATLAVASVWLVHGLYNKLLHGSPRHLAIVQSVPGFDGSRGEHLLTAVGLVEVAIALWVLSGWTAHVCAAVQTVLLLTMNAVELTVARHLLLWPAGLIPANLCFLALAWVAASAPAKAAAPARAKTAKATLLTRLRRQPVPVCAHLQDCLTLTYAVPPHVLRPFLPPGLELETSHGYGFVAVALVDARSMRPAGIPKLLGRDFFLAGYRVFTRFRTPDGRTLRGLRILRSDTNGGLMAAAGNLLTHYNFRRCHATMNLSSDRIRVTVQTRDEAGDLEVSADLRSPTLPPGSPFSSVREARRFAGPLPFTFDYERETHAIVAINATRTHWQPAPIEVDVRRIAFFDQPAFRGCTPVLAAAFYVKSVDYRWERGVRYRLEFTSSP
jgi:hypothetical protein